MAGDLQRVEAQLVDSAQSREGFLTEIASHLIAGGGKRVRPGFCMAAAATAFVEDQPASPEAVTGGVAVELVHLGSLYHDDVMDEAEVRRALESVNSRWGNHRAILAGDFLLARASELAAGLGTEVAGLLAATIGSLCEGQLLELQYTYNIDRTEDVYFRSINGKTASLLAASCRIGAIVSELPSGHIDALTTFGHAYGTAFQLVDDVLDLVSTDEALGKPAGHDLEEGVYTLPVLIEMSGSGNAGSRPNSELKSLLGGTLDESARLRALDMVRSGDGIRQTIDRAREFAQAGHSALGDLPASPGIVGLNAAADYLLESVESAAA